MKLKMATLLTTLIAATAAFAEVPNFEERISTSEPVSDPNSCRYVGIGVGVPHLDLNLGARKRWNNNGIDVGINGETSNSIEKQLGDISQVLGYVNYLLFPNSGDDASFYVGAGASAGLKFPHHQPARGNEFVSEGNLLIGRSFSNKQFVQAKVGIPIEYDSDKVWINRIENTQPNLTVSYGIGF